MTDLNLHEAPDVDPEQYVLGAMMLSRDALLDVLGSGLRAEHFRRPAHTELYEALTEAFTRVNGAVDPLVLAAELEQRGTLIRCGGAPYLHTLMATPHTATNAGYYADLVLRSHKVREIHTIGARFQQLAENGAAGADLDAILDKARAALDELVAIGRRDDGGEFDEVVDAWLTSLGTPKSVPLSTGIQELDELLGGGFRPGQLVVIGARPGVGKSVVGTNFAVAAAQRGNGVLLCSMEMTRDEVLERVFADQADIPLDRIREPRLMSLAERRRLELSADRVASLPLKIVDTGKQTLGSIRAAARDRTRTPRGLRLLVVDYLQLMTTTSRTDKRHEIVGEFSRELKLLAKELGITVVALAQLNRASEQRADKRPQLSDLRESGSLEQDADIVALLHRDPDDQEAMDFIEFRIPKHRGGPTGVRDLFWVGPHQRVTGQSGQSTAALRVVQ